MENIYDLKWQTRNEVSQPTNPLQKLTECLTSTPKDIGEDKLLSFMYGVIVGWDDKSYKQLQKKHNWTKNDIKYQKLLHENYKELWKLYIK